ncbi:hypothetical protein PF010_g4640 [Phytophthora fragariae]|nr:hypothetical protein PF010_g4640 [Phytophthora fragariae]
MWLVAPLSTIHSRRQSASPSSAENAMLAASAFVAPGATCSLVQSITKCPILWQMKHLILVTSCFNSCCSCCPSPPC